MTTPPKMHGRRPADQAGDPRQTIWTAIKAREGEFTIVDIVAATRLNRSTVYGYLRSLAAAEFLSHREAAVQSQPARWVLIRDNGFHAPRLRRDGSPSLQGEATAQMWRSMCALREFSFRDLIENASVVIAEATARDYCHHLLAAGYFRVVAKANPAQGKVARYRLIRESGPRPPQIQRVKRVFDPNTGETFAGGRS